MLPSESFLYMQISVTTENYNKDTETAKRINLTKHFPSFLFSDARYELNGVEIDRNRNVGITSLLKLSTASCKSNIMAYYRFVDSCKASVAETENGLLFDVVVPLSTWFGFCEDYRKVILNCRHELILNRASTNANCFEGGKEEAGSASVKLKINKLEWKMPVVSLADKVKLNMNGFLTKSKQFSIQHRTELPPTTKNMWSVKTTSIQINQDMCWLLSSMIN